MKPLLIYSTQDSSRLRYVLDWLFAEQSGLTYEVTSDQSLANISYGTIADNTISIPDAGLLWQKDIHKQSISCGNWNGTPTIFQASGGAYTLPFDLFSAIFFLLSRYEEYYSFIPDKHNRYPATSSILFKNGWLERPLLDEWVFSFRDLLAWKKFPVNLKTFSFQPTYDIDIAYSFLHKGLSRTVGASIKDFSNGRFSTINTRLAVLAGKQKDPYDSFDFMSSLHRSLRLRPTYFILSSGNTTTFDKNIPLSHPAMTVLIKQLAREGTIGIHPSYYSDVKTELLRQEKSALEKLTGNSINISRQHYIKMCLPLTHRQLISAGITDDYSMGYGTHLGFRAGTGQSFLWYDLMEETTTALRIHPFCFMDTTAMFENDLPAKHAFERLNKMTELLLATKSQLITVFHNFSLGTATEWKGWREAYASFLERITF